MRSGSSREKEKSSGIVLWWSWWTTDRRPHQEEDLNLCVLFFGLPGKLVGHCVKQASGLVGPVVQFNHALLLFSVKGQGVQIPPYHYIPCSVHSSSKLNREQPVLCSSLNGIRVDGQYCESMYCLRGFVCYELIALLTFSLYLRLKLGPLWLSTFASCLTVLSYIKIMNYMSVLIRWQLAELSLFYATMFFLATVNSVYLIYYLIKICFPVHFVMFLCMFTQPKCFHWKTENIPQQHRPLVPWKISPFVS